MAGFLYSTDLRDIDACKDFMDGILMERDINFKQVKGPVTETDGSKFYRFDFEPDAYYFQGSVLLGLEFKTSRKRSERHYIFQYFYGTEKSSPEQIKNFIDATNSIDKYFPIPPHYQDIEKIKEWTDDLFAEMGITPLSTQGPQQQNESSSVTYTLQRGHCQTSQPTTITTRPHSDNLYHDIHTIVINSENSENPDNARITFTYGTREQQKYVFSTKKKLKRALKKFITRVVSGTRVTTQTRLAGTNSVTVLWTRIHELACRAEGMLIVGANEDETFLWDIQRIASHVDTLLADSSFTRGNVQTNARGPQWQYSFIRYTDKNDMKRYFDVANAESMEDPTGALAMVTNTRALQASIYPSWTDPLTFTDKATLTNAVQTLLNSPGPQN